MNPHLGNIIFGGVIVVAGDTHTLSGLTLSASGGGVRKGEEREGGDRDLFYGAGMVQALSVVQASSMAGWDLGRLLLRTAGHLADQQRRALLVLLAVLAACGTLAVHLRRAFIRTPPPRHWPGL